MNRNFLLSIISLIKCRTFTNILTHVQSKTHVSIWKAWNHCLKVNLQNSHNIFMQSMSKIQHTKHSHWHSRKTTSFPQLFRNILTRRSFSSKNNFRWIFSWPNFSISFVFEHDSIQFNWKVSEFTDLKLLVYEFELQNWSYYFVANLVHKTLFLDKISRDSTVYKRYICSPNKNK